MLVALVACGMFAAENKEKSPVSLKWELLKSENKTFKNGLTLKNVGDSDLKGGWSIYFNMFQRKLDVEPGCPVDISLVENGYFRMSPKSNFLLKKGKSVEIRFNAHGELPNRSYAPGGFHFAFDTDKVARSVKIEYAEIDPTKMVRYANYPTGESLYKLNEELNPVEKAEFDAFEILPAMKFVARKPGKSSLAAKFTVEASAILGRELAYAQTMLSKCGILADGSGTAKLQLELMSRSDAMRGEAADNNEYYEIAINGNEWTVKGVTADAVLNGVKSVGRILDRNRGKESVPNAEIADYPDFHYRGIMVDVARNFSNADNLKKLIGKLAEYKINRLHFHFSDDEGWRLEIPGIPELTAVGARRGMLGSERDHLFQSYSGNGNPDDLSTTSNGYVSKAEFIDLLRYANSLGIEVIPEIESPGHARAVIVSMKARYENLKDSDLAAAEEFRVWDFHDTSKYTSIQGYNDNVLNPAQEGTYRFFSKVVDEIILMYEEAGAKLPYIHVGGDEVPRNPWTESPDVQKLMAEKGLKTTHDVEEYFITRVADLIAAKGVKIGGWQESAMRHSKMTDERLRPNFGGVYCWNTVPEWGGDSIPYSVANNGYPVVLCNVGNLYIDLAYNAHPEEPGLNWGGHVNEFTTWGVKPYDVYHSLSTTVKGEPLDMARIADGKPMLTAASRRNIKGLQCQLFSETIKNFDMVEYYVFPKIFGLAERSWNADLLPGQSKAGYNLLLGTCELPALERDGFNFRLGMPGIKKEGGKIHINACYPGVEIRYTTDGSKPTAKSRLYTEPIPAKGRIVRAKAFYLGKESVASELPLKAGYESDGRFFSR